MPVQTYCPHCQSRCLVAEQHFGLAVLCFQCKRPFTVPAPLASTGPSPPSPGHGRGLLEIGSATSPGRLRERNEDSFLVQHWTWANQDRFDELALVVVADGMGGHRAGAHASGLVVRTVALTLAPLLSGVWKSESRSWTINHLESDLIQAILEANRAVHGQAQRDPECEGMGATAVAALVWNNRAVICHVGDTRVYHRRGSEFVQVTRDQTLVARMIELGQLAPEEADTHPARHEVLQALGRREDLEPAAYTLQLAPHDWLIVASDGLHADLEAGAIQNAFQSANPSAGWIAHHLVKAAEEAGGSDNCTVVAIRRQGG